MKPNFFGKIARMKGYYDSHSKNYQFHDTTMDYLQHSVNAYRMEYSCKTFIPFSDMLIDDDYAQRSVKYPQVDRILELVRNMRAQIKSVWDSKMMDWIIEEKLLLSPTSVRSATATSNQFN